MKCTLYICLLILLLAVPLYAAMPPDSALIRMEGSGITMDAVNAVVQAAAEGGGRICHVMPVHIGSGPARVLTGCCLIGSVAPGSALETAIMAMPYVTAQFRGPVDPAVFEPIGTEAFFAAHAWNFLLAGGGETEPGPSMDPFEGDGRPRLVNGRPVGEFKQSSTFSPMSSGAQTPAPLSSPGMYQTSEFMIGSVAVGVVLPESNGNGENWSTARQTTVYNAIVSAANWWVTQGGANAFLTFYYDQQFSIATQYEPITLASTNDGTWIADVMTTMGYAGATHFDQAYSYVNAIRNANGTDWAFVVYVADSLNDVDGMFPDGLCAYAYINGPYVVLTYDNDGWGINRMNLVMAHEMGHTFGAGDEYGGCGCGSYGYLGIPNSNCVNCTPNQAPCIMVSNVQQICNYTLGQIGWQDTDGDTKYDPVDTNPAMPIAYLDFGPMPPFWGAAQIQGHGLAMDNACPSPVGASCSINKVFVSYSIDGGPWIMAMPRDGAFNSDFENFDFMSPAVAKGPHMVMMQCWNSYGGNFGAAPPMTITVDTTPPIPPTSVTDAGAGTILPDSLTFNWTPAMEDWSPVVDYQLNVYDQIGNQVVSRWVGNILSHTEMPLPLMLGSRYFATVAAKNGAGLIGPISPMSDGIMKVMSFFPSIQTAKLGAPMGTPIGIDNVITTSSGSDATGVVYVQQASYLPGIRTDSTDSISPGSIVQVAGKVMLTTDMELYLMDSEVASLGGFGSIVPAGMAGRSLGGGTFGNQNGFGAGLNTTGMLVKTWGGDVTFVSPIPPAYFVVDDGSGQTDRFGNPGIGVACGSIMPPGLHSRVSVTGISSLVLGRPVVLLRQAGDWRTY